MSQSYEYVSVSSSSVPVVESSGVVYSSGLTGGASGSNLLVGGSNYY